jgi:hypothetical protein
MKTAWSQWRSFPDARSGGTLTAPFGPGCHELRRRDGQLVLFGMAGHVADRMTSLSPFGSGTRLRWRFTSARNSRGKERTS